MKQGRCFSGLIKNQGAGADLTEISEKISPDTKRDLLLGASANLFGFIVRLGARLPFLLVVAILYGKELYGQYLFAVTVVETLTVIIVFGFRRTLFQFLNDDFHNNNAGGVYNTVLTALVICVGVGVSIIIPAYFVKDIFFGAFSNEMIEGVFLILPASIIYALAELLLTATRVTRKMRYEVTAKSIVEPYVLVAASVGLFYMNAVEYGLFIAYWIMNAAIFIYAIFAFRKTFGKQHRQGASISLDKIKSMISFSSPTVAYDLLGTVILRIDIYFLAAMVSPALLGIYGIALQITTITKKIRQSFDPVLEPIISRTIKRSSLKNVSDELSRVSYWIFSIQGLTFTLLLFYGAPLLGLFGASGSEITITLLILVGAVVVNGSFGLGELIFLYSKPAVNPALSLGILFLHASLSYFLIARYGIIGAASSLLIVYIVAESVRFMLVKHFFDVFPLSKEIFKVLIASSILLGYLLLVSYFVELYSVEGAVIGIIGGIAVYTFSLFAISDGDGRIVILKVLGLDKANFGDKEKIISCGKPRYAVIHANAQGDHIVSSISVRDRLIKACIASNIEKVFVISRSGTKQQAYREYANGKVSCVEYIDSIEQLGAIIEQPGLHIRDGSLLHPALLDGFLSSNVKILKNPSNGRTVALKRGPNGQAGKAGAGSQIFNFEPFHIFEIKNSNMLGEAHSRLFSWLIKKSDGIVSIYMNRPISTFFSKFFANYAIHPFYFTGVTALIATSMVYAFSTGGETGALWGCILFHAASVFDGVDGEIARAKFQVSLIGAKLDTAVDMVTNILFMGGISFVLWDIYGDDYLTLGIVIVALAMNGILMMTSLIYFGPGGGSFDILATTIRRRFMHSQNWLLIFQTFNSLLKRDFFAFIFAVFAVLGLIRFIPEALIAGLVIWNLAIVVNSRAILQLKPVTSRI
jgi:O-antigen/teichoic acid export membrane protein/phosphatidylglycerophosphate synthase